MRHIRLLLPLAALACGGEGPSEPTRTASIAGAWQYAADGTSGDIVCTARSVTLELVELGGSGIAGTLDGGRFRCTHDSQVILDFAADSVEVEGSRSGSSIFLRFDGWLVGEGHSGEIAGARITGTLYDNRVEGTWAATR